jgi:Acyl-CoA dehydrogenase, C-terminal domain
MSAQDRIQMRWDATYVAELSRRVVERLFAAAGARGLYRGVKFDLVATRGPEGPHFRPRECLFLLPAGSPARFTGHP